MSRWLWIRFYEARPVSFFESSLSAEFSFWLTKSPQVWCPAVCAKTWCLNEFLTRLRSFGWFYCIVFDFAMEEIYKCCWLWIPCLDHVNMEIHSMHIALISILPILLFMYCWALSIRFLLCHRRSVSDRHVQTHAISDHFLWQNVQMFQLRWFMSIPNFSREILDFSPNPKP
jgi:hypothetical protein